MERSGLSLPGHKIGERVLVLISGVCLAAVGLFAANNPSLNNRPKSVSHSTTAPTYHHAAAKKPATHASTSHTAAHRRSSSPSGSVHAAARKTPTHTGKAYASQRSPNHSSAYASQHKATAAHNKHAAPARPHTLSGQQRLARIHMQPERAQEIQLALIREGYLQGEPSGQWDSHTHEAMQRYQIDHGFPATGMPEAKSLMKLGLGAHPLAPELDHGPVAGAPSATQNVFTVSPASPPISQATPPSQGSEAPASK